jgi:hypothetical protein
MKPETPAAYELTVFSRYLIKRTPNADQGALYERALAYIGTTKTDRTFGTALRHPWLLPYLDAHDAFFRPSSELRQRLYLAFSILEASPDFAELFLPRTRSGWYIFGVIGHGIRSIFRLVVGTIVVKIRGL